MWLVDRPVVETGWLACKASIITIIWAARRPLFYPLNYRKWNCGDVGSWTRVQTRKPYVFYMFSSILVFVIWQDLNHPTISLSFLKFHYAIKDWHNYFWFNCTTMLISLRKKQLIKWCPVPTPRIGIKQLTYCTSIRQRERKYFRQLVFDQWIKE